MDLKLEVVIIPVADADRAKEFYSKLGWRLDADVAGGEASRLIQFTPPGSWCSIQFGKGLTTASPGSVQGLYLVVSDIEEARAHLIAKGADVSGVFHCSDGFTCRFSDNGKRTSGLQPERLTGKSFVTVSDVDGNSYLVQDMPKRIPGRVTGNTTFSSVQDLAQAIIRASKAHHQHEGRTGQADTDWGNWYAEYMVREQSGEKLPE
jgi:catechol 2,3-dioxygenase-like lactoylglutathione lyase family enzyme